LGNYP